MMISVDGKVYTKKDVSLFVWLDKEDIENIKNMHPDCRVYAEINDNGSINDAEKQIRYVRACFEHRLGDRTAFKRLLTEAKEESE